MASAEVVSPEVVLQAMATMRSGDTSQKKAAMDYLQRFQKSVCLATRLYRSMRRAITTIARL